VSIACVNHETEEGQLPLFQPLPDTDPAGILKILVWPNPVLHQISEPVSEFDTIELKQLVTDMFATMRHGNGIGLAAPQVNVLKRVITLEIEPNRMLYFINPRVVWESEEMYSWEEGCLSVPGYFEKRDRPQEILVETADFSGNITNVRLQGLYAFALQHEIDHLNGIVFVDDLSNLKKDRVKAKVKKTLRHRGL
jgi:peptide deformylase